MEEKSTTRKIFPSEGETERNHTEVQNKCSFYPHLTATTSSQMKISPDRL